MRNKSGYASGWSKWKLSILVFFMFSILIFTPFRAKALEEVILSSDFIIAIDDNSRLYYAKSNWNGTFSDYAFIDYLGGANARAVTINDFDNDGDMDFIAGRGISSTAYYYLFLNNGLNNFTKTAMVGTLSNINSWAMDMASGDFNNDGWMDFIANCNYPNTGIYINDKKGGFTKTELNLGNNGRGMDVADFNNDGNLDFARATNSDGITRIYPGNGDGTFGAAISVGDTGDDPYGLAAGDFNNDGNADIIVNSGSGGDPYFFAGNGDNTFDAQVYIATLDFNRHGAYDGFDFNKDGNLDIVAVNYDGRQVIYYPGNGDGTFGASVIIGTTTNPSLDISSMPIGPPFGVPVAAISPSTQTISLGNDANFDGSASYDTDEGSLASWLWNFGDANTESGEGTNVGTTSNTYSAEGIYYPNLKVTDNDGKSDYAAAQAIVEGSAPTVDTRPVTFGENLADQGIWKITLTGTDYASDTEGIISYKWDLNDGLNENFEDNNSDGWNVFAGTWAVYNTSIGASPTYSYRQSNVSPDRTWTIFNKVFDTDIKIEADVSLVSGTGEEAQIIFKAKDDSNNYEFILRGRGNNDVLFYKRVNGGTTNLFEYDLPSTITGSSYPIDIGHTYHIKIEYEGTLFKFYLDGRFLFAWSDSTWTSGRVGFSTYRTEALFDNLTVTSIATGPTVQHSFLAGTYNVQLTANDAAGQTTADVIPMTMAPGNPPAANAGGPYSVNEAAASKGIWTVNLNGSASSDDVEIRKYVWDFGLDPFNGTEFEYYKWFTNDGISQNNEVSITGASTWDTRYMVTKSAYPKVKGQVFQTKIKVSAAGQCMFGFKNEISTNFHYNQFPYEFYLYNGNIYIYENNNSRGDTGYGYSYGIWYDFKIELKDAGAVYSYRPSGTTFWYEVYNSNYTTADINLRKGIVAYSSTYFIDDFVETTAGQSPVLKIYGEPPYPKNIPFNLTVYDRAGQTNTASDTITLNSSAGPVGNFDIADNKSPDETGAVDGIWTVNFDASTATIPFSDDFGIIIYEWDFDNDGVIDFSSTVPTASHGYSAPGTYTVRLKVSDNALQTFEDTLTVTVSQGNPPSADAGGPYSVDEITGNAFEGGWTVALDGSGSSDGETTIAKYVWELGTDTFDGTIVNKYKWFYNSSTVTQNNQIIVTPTSSGWGKDYLFSKDNYTRIKGMAFEAKVRQNSAGNAMVGFKNTNTTYNYNNMPYAIYFNAGNIYIYESASNRGDTGYNYSYNTDYDVRIELKPISGATYYYRIHGDPEWILLYDSSYGSDASLKRGLDVYSGIFIIDDMKEIAAGPTPTYRFYELGSRDISLTVWDNSFQTAADSTSVTISANDPPIASAGPDKSGGETDAFEGTWTISFNGSGSTDDHGIYKYEWDWNYNGDSFNPSGDIASIVSHIYTSPGTYTVALRVTDHALQSNIDTALVTLTISDPPIAEAGPDKTTEGHWPVAFDGGGSSDDVGIYRYSWDFGDGKTGTGKTPKHIYWSPGDYIVTLTVYDNAMQSDSDTLTVHVITGDLPSADAGGPYTAGVGGPPAYFNGSGSRDDYGVVKYLWDADIATDSNLDQDSANDIDAVGRKPFYTYNAAGTYTVRLTVIDGMGQSATADATVNVADNLAPDVICVPWQAGNPTIPHETYNGRSIRLKAIVRDAGTLQYKWAFGDGTFSPADGTSYTAVTNKYAIEASHTYPASADGTPYTAVLTVKDSNGLIGTDNYYIIVKPDNLDTRTNIAVDEGLWWLHKNQNKTDGKWSSYGSYYSSPTASAIQAFEINGHLQNGDNQENPYVETVDKGFAYMFTTLASTNIANQTYGNPDTNGNGIGIGVNSDRPIYEGGMVMDAIASSNNPLSFALTGGASIKGRFYFDILTDMVDMYAWGQYDHATVGGGWRYSWGDGPDNSACQWAAIGMLAAEDTFGINIPQWVKDRNNVWLNYSYDGTGFGYTGAGNDIATTPSGMVQLAFDDKYTTDLRWRTAEDYIANNWFWQHDNYYAAYSLVKALRLARPNPVSNLQSTGLDWYNDTAIGVRKHLIDDQVKTSTEWGSWLSGGYGGRGFNTAWAIIMLTPTLFVQPPVADAGDDIIWAYDYELKFDASGSYHTDPALHIVKYEWDFDGDGIYDFTTTNPSDPNAKWTYPDPDPNTPRTPPTVYIARLRVTDNNEPAQIDIDTRKVTASEPPHAPYAVHGGPYKATAGIPFTLDGSGSHDINVGDGISKYQWDLDNDGKFFDNVEIDTANAITSWTYALTGVYNIALKVWDKGVFNGPGGSIECTVGVDCIPMESLPAFTTVTVTANEPPIADAGGPYQVDEGSALTLDGTGSSDPNGDTLTYAWDLDNDGEYDDSANSKPARTWNDNGTNTVGLKVSDSLLNDTDTAQVTVVNVAPDVNAGTDQTANEGSSVHFAGAFTDPGTSDTHTFMWDFGDSSNASGSLTADHVYLNNGIYTVTLTVTDDDQGVGTDTLTVTVNDLGPNASLTGPVILNKNQAGNFDASGSTSSPDAIAGYEWDWNYDGTFNPSEGAGAIMSHSFNENGIFTVAVRVADDDGSTDIATLEVRVPVTVIAVNAGADKVVDEGDNVSFSGSFNNPAGGTAHTIVWNLGDGSTAAGTLTPSHIYPDNGTYTITLTITDEFDNIGQDTLTVTVNDLSPIAALNGDTILVPDQTGNFDASGSISSPDEITGYEWDWNYNGTFNPSEDTGETQSHSYNEPGIYNVAVRVTDDDGSADIATLVVVVSSTVLEVDAGPDQNVYKNDIVNFNGNFNDQNEGVTYTYLWDFGDNNTSEGALTPSHVYAETGVFTVTLTITGDDGSFGTDTLIVTVTEPGETSVDLQINAGTKNEDYVMISFPIDCDNIDAVDLLELKVNTKDLRLGTYDPNYPPPDGTGGYIEYGKGLKIQKGRAYFILSRSALKISANCLRVSLNQDIEVPLWFNPNNQNGWNQIGPPNDRDYTWEDVEVISKDGNGAIIFGPVAIKNLPNENNYIDKRLWEYKPDGTYDPDTAILRSKKGYFIRVKRANVFLVFSRNAQIAQNSSMTNVLLAQTKENLKRFFDKWILSPNNAFAVSNDYPPGPIGNFTVEKSGSSSGGCFIEAANDGFPLRPKGVILILLSLIIMLGIAVGRKINKRLKVL